MSRMTNAVVIGYLSTSLLAFIGLLLAYLALGAESAFQPESFKPSGSWLTLTFAAGFVAGTVGGVVASLVGTGTKAPLILAEVVLMLGFLIGVVVLIANGTEAAPRAGNLPVMEAIARAQLPAWVALLYPIVGKVGVYLGGWAIRRGDLFT